MHLCIHCSFDPGMLCRVSNSRGKEIWVVKTVETAIRNAMPSSGSGTGASRLQSLDGNGGGFNANGGGSTSGSIVSNGSGNSASLRGNFHNRVPDISNQPLHTLLPVVKDGWLPPEPYYITQNVVYVPHVP